MANFIQTQGLSIVISTLVIVGAVRYLPSLITYTKYVSEQLIILAKSMTVAVENNTVAMRENKETLEANLKMQESTLRLLQTQAEPIRLMSEMIVTVGKQLDTLVTISHKLPHVGAVEEMEKRFTNDHKEILEKLDVLINKK